MNGYDTHDEHQPLLWFRGQPIYAAYFVIIVFVASLLATIIANISGLGHLALAGTFDSAAVLRGEVWRVFTYGLINQPSLWFVIDMLMIAWFGRELEKFFGRRKFLALYLGLYLLKPLLHTVLGFWIHTRFSGQIGGFALFVAFATLYPNAVLLFNLLAKWVAIVLVAIYALMALNSAPFELIGLFASTGFAFAFVRYQQGLLTLPSFRLRRGGPRLRVLPDPEPSSPRRAERSHPAAPRGNQTTAEMDALLDKIARSGMASLTAEERARLDEAARTHTLRKYGR